MYALDHLNAEKLPTEVLMLSADFRAHATRRVREPDHDYEMNTCVVPATRTGFQYRATTAGVTGHREPRWPLIAGQTVRDGSVVWTAEVISTASLERSLSSASWDAGGLTLTNFNATAQEAVALVSGGTAGQAYRLRCDGTFSDGIVKSVTIDLEVVAERRT